MWCSKRNDVKHLIRLMPAPIPAVSSALGPEKCTRALSSALGRPECTWIPPCQVHSSDLFCLLRRPCFKYSARLRCESFRLRIIVSTLTNTFSPTPRHTSRTATTGRHECQWQASARRRLQGQNDLHFSRRIDRVPSQGSLTFLRSSL